MKNWTIMTSFTYPHEAYVIKSRLESDGIEVFLKDEYTVQVNNLYSNAIGGVKLLVKNSDFDRAYEILKQGGYIKDSEDNSLKFKFNLKKFTFSSIPTIGKQLILTIFLIALIFVLYYLFI